MNFSFNINPTLNGKTVVVDPRGVTKNEGGVVSWKRESAILECGSWSYLVGSTITRYSIPLEKIVIGKFCSIAQNVRFIGANNHHYDWITSYPLELLISIENNFHLHEDQPRNTSIGNDVWIGENATIMPGVHLSDGCCIGTDSLITKSTEPYGVYGGNPARLIKYRFNDEVVARLLKIQWWQLNNNFIKNNAKNIFSSPTNEILELLSNLSEERVSEEEVRNIVIAKLV